MITPINTNDLEFPAGSLPAAIPDPQTLGRWAAELFGQLGGAGATPGTGQLSGPVAPGVAEPVSGTPTLAAARLAPVAPPTGTVLPDPPAGGFGAPPGGPLLPDPSAGMYGAPPTFTTSFGPPDIFAAALPQIAPVEPGTPYQANSPGPASESWFYFVDHAAAGSERGTGEAAHPPFDVHAIRRDFPILAERVNGRQIVWLDNAATTQKPRAVIDRIAHFYAHENSNIHRAAHELAARATDAYEGARGKVARFLGASSADEIVFVRGATEAINLVAQSWGRQFVGKDDEIVVSHLEHHANIVPWQQLALEKGARLRVIPVDDSGQIILEEYRRLLNDRTKLVAVAAVSNALGTVTPVQEIVDLAHRAGARVLIDGAQAVSHMRVNVGELDPDFYVFSGHKLFGPTGIGALYGKPDALASMPPWQGGGNMIADVSFDHTVYQAPPARFEAGTGNIADAVGLGAAIDYVERIGLENIARYEHDLLAYATRALLAVPGLRLIGTAREKTSVLSFILANYRTEEVGQALNEEGIAVRAGHHCAQPILRRFGVESTVRPSLAFYNTCEEVDLLAAALRRLARAREV